MKTKLLLFFICINIFLAGATGQSLPDTLIVGVYDNHPKVFISDDMQAQGIFVDIIQHIAEKEGWNLKFEYGDWDELLKKLQNGDIDIMPDVAFTPSRDSLYTFNAVPVLESWVQAYSLKGSSYLTSDDLNGKKIAVLEGSIQEKILRDMMADSLITRCTLLTYKNYSETASSLVKGETDVMIASRFFSFSTQRWKEVVSTPLVFRSSQLFFCYTKNRYPLLPALTDKWLSTLVNDPQSVYYESLDRWLNQKSFGTMPGYIRWIIYLGLFLLAAFAVFMITLRRIVKERTRQLKQKNDELEEVRVKLQDGTDFLNGITQTVPAGIYRLYVPPHARVNSDGMPEFRFVFFSQALADITGIEEQELYQNPALFINAIYPDDRADFLKTNAAVHLSKEKFVWEGRLQKGEEITWCHFESALRINKDGSNIWTGFVQDITDKKLTELELQKSEELFHNLAVISPVGIFITDEKGLTTYVNPKWCELSGLSAEEAKGNGWMKALHPDDREKVRQTWEERFSKKEKSYDDYRFVHKDGKVIWVMGYAVPEKTNGKISGYIGTTTDITDRKHTEEILRQKNLELQTAIEKAQESDRLKSAFLANMSHEIRTPMNAICGFSNLLKTTTSETKKRDYIEIINNNSQQLLKIIGDIIEISKIEANQIDIRFHSMSLNETLNFIADTYRQQAEAQRIILKTHYPLSAPADHIMGDEILISQIMHNLLTNAIKFTREGYIEIGYTVNQDWLEVYVRDTGIGIDDELHGIIFERFRQVEDKENYRSRRGTGLGLPIARSYVRLMGGDIRLESSPGNGSVFFFTLPYQPVESEIAIEKKKEPANNVAWDETSIMIVEDDLSNYEFLKTVVSDMNVKIYWASTGSEARDILKKNNDITLILMDIKLPDTDGISLSKEIKERHPEMKIIAQTAYAFASDKEKALSMGIDSYLTKPLDINALLSEITAALNRK